MSRQSPKTAAQVQFAARDLVCGRPAWLKVRRPPNTVNFQPNTRARNSEPLPVMTFSSCQPRADRSRAALRVGRDVHLDEGLRGVVCS